MSGALLQKYRIVAMKRNEAESRDSTPNSRSGASQPPSKKRALDDNVNLKRKLETRDLETPLAKYLSEATVILPNSHFISSHHVNYFQALFDRSPHLKTVLNIGFGYGHSADLFLSLNDRIHVISLDNVILDWVMKKSMSFISETYPNRHMLIAGNSESTLPALSAISGIKFDLIYIDGSILGDQIDADIINCRSVSTPSTLIVMDGLKPFSKGGVARYTSWNRAVMQGLIKENEISSSEDLVNVWGRCTFHEETKPKDNKFTTMLDSYYRKNPKATLWMFTQKLEQSKSLTEGKRLWDQLMHNVTEIDEWAFNSYLKILRNYKDPSYQMIVSMRNDRFPRKEAAVEVAKPNTNLYDSSEI